MKVSEADGFGIEDIRSRLAAGHLAATCAPPDDQSFAHRSLTHAITRSIG
jgi:hypothetical protein